MKLSLTYYDFFFSIFNNPVIFTASPTKTLSITSEAQMMF